MPTILILIPLIGVIALNLLFGRRGRRVAYIFGILLFIVYIIFAICHKTVRAPACLKGIDEILRLSFAGDQLSYIMLLSIGIVSLSGLLIARSTIPDANERFKFINLLILCSMGMCGIIMVRDLFSLYVFLEVSAIAAFILIAFNRTAESLEGAFKYLLLSAVATAMMLASIALLLLITTDTSFAAIHTALDISGKRPMAVLAMALFICGLFIKGGIVPFHGWLPDAYAAAPAAISIILAGIITKANGMYTLIRVVTDVFGFGGPVKGMLLAFGAVSILTGAFMALAQTDFKRMLAYSSISQVGYIVLGLGAGTPLGLAGAVFHLFNHAIFKTLLFVNSAAVETRLGTNNMDNMGGLSGKMPVTGTTSVIAMLSTCGIPPLAGFWSKIIIVVALWQCGRYGYATLAVIASLITLAYFLSLQRRVFFGKLAKGLEDIREADGAFVLVSIALAAITVFVGILFPFVFNDLILPVSGMITIGK